MDVKVILTPPYILISLVILHTKYTGARQNDFNVYAYSSSPAGNVRLPPERRVQLALPGPETAVLGC
jgi:hypothetical protein